MTLKKTNLDERKATLDSHREAALVQKRVL
jgi:hypothetical protein